MDFDEIVVKESPGLCRCCLSEGCYKDLSTEYTWMDDTEIYADMLLECFDISISQHIEGPNGPNRLICEVCITRLRDACNFKKQVLASEKKFVDMIGRGAFKTKVVMYSSSVKAETTMDVQAQEPDVEYLEEELNYIDDNLLKEERPVVPTEDITVTTLPVKGKRGRPRKNAVKTDKKAKIAKTDDKPRSSKAIAKGIKIGSEVHESYLERLHSVRRNIIQLLHFGNLVPFHWNTNGFKCFYCNKTIIDCDILREHTISHAIDLETFIPQRVISKDVPVKVDVKDIACKICNKTIDNIEDLIAHIVSEHDQEYDGSTGTCIFPFNLNKSNMKCVLCDAGYDNFNSMLAHMFRDHINHKFICQICGLGFVDQVRLHRHISNCHNGHTCKICGKVFDAFHKVDKHRQRIHGQVRSHVCSICGVESETLYRLKVHMGKVHNVEKYRIRCDLCPKVCTTKGAMMLHVQSLHPSVKYQCDLCEYTTGIRWMLKLHQRKHFGEKNYSCSICERRFGRSSNLRAHMKVHTGNFGRVCRWCRRGFVDFDTLSAHEKELHYYELYK